MAYFNTCPLCGDNLDPGERCDCQQERNNKKRVINSMLQIGSGGQMHFELKCENLVFHEKR